MHEVVITDIFLVIIDCITFPLNVHSSFANMSENATPVNTWSDHMWENVKQCSSFIWEGKYTTKT